MNINPSEVETLRGVIADLKAEIERQRAGRGIEQMMLTNALPELVALGRIREVTAALDRIYVKSTEDAEAGYRGADIYADAYEYATRLLHAALEPTP